MISEELQQLCEKLSLAELLELRELIDILFLSKAPEIAAIFAGPLRESMLSNDLIKQIFQVQELPNNERLVEYPLDYFNNAQTED